MALSSLPTPTIEEAGGEVRWYRGEHRYRVRYAWFPVQGDPKGSVVFLPGYTEFIEKHIEPIDELRARGLNVLILDWRGQGLSDRLLDDRTRGHIESMEHHVDDVRGVLADFDLAEAPDRTLLLGHSMGGHLAVRLLKDMPERFARAILSAPMADINTLAVPRSVADLVGTIVCGLGFGRLVVPATGRSIGQARRFEGNPLTHDRDRLARTFDWVDKNPDLFISGPSFHWVNEALKSIKLVLSPGYLESIRTPTLLVAATDERIVRLETEQEWMRRMPNGVYREVEGALHELMNEADQWRHQFWVHVDEFLEQDPTNEN